MNRLAGLLVTIVAAACAAPASTGTGSPIPPATAEPVTPAPTATMETTARATPSAEPSEPAALSLALQRAPLPQGSQPHDVAPAADGGVWYTGQGNGTLGWFDPETDEVREVALGAGSAPHGVITGPDGDAWVTDGGLNAIVRVDADTLEVSAFPVEVPNANLNTAAFDGEGILWFTGQAGIYGRLDPATGDLVTYPAPREIGPYGIATTPDGEVVFSSLAGSYIGFIDRASGEVTVVDTPTPGGGARRVWSDSSGGLWVTEWFAGMLARYDPGTETWTEWRLPGANPQPYAVYVDETDAVWVTDFGANALLRFDPATEAWTSLPHEASPANVRQLLGRPGEVWGVESAADTILVVRHSGG
jgi:virginiamycin B lyase